MNQDIILNWVENNKEQIWKNFKTLVQIPSLTGEEAQAQSFVAKHLKALSTRVEMKEPNIKELFEKYPEIAQYPSSWQPELDLPLKFYDICTYEQLMNSPYAEKLTYKGRPNVVATLQGTGNGRSLILNGHIDVVTIGDKNRWNCEPFGAQEKNGRIYGRGTSDMKGGLWAMITALEAIIRCGISLKGDVIVQSVVNEEHSGNGSLACVAEGYQADAALVCEPTGSKSYSKTSGGGVYWEMKLTGKEAHTGSRWKDGKANGISAIEKTPLLINALLAHEAEENKEQTKLSLGIGTIKGGDYATSTARECVISGVVYFSPALGTGVKGIQKVKALFANAIEEASKNDPWLLEHKPEVSYLHYDDAYCYPEDSEFASVLCHCGKKVLGKELEEISFSACDARHLGNQGGIPVIIYGPGDLSLAHSIDESIDKEDLISAVKVIACTICDWCGVEE